MNRDRTFHYVPHHAALDWLNCGWVVVRQHGHSRQHDGYHSLMEWLCDCKMARPAR